ncbi:MAG TPA: BatD family protein [Steroidobacteraceae bacterium]|nr:BatD family protein [Steroidobacteraceae bacterium]
MSTNRIRGWLIAGTACLGVTAPALAAPPPVQETIEPAQITLGESARLTVTSLGTGMEPVTLPTVPGLELRVVGQSQRIEIINGTTLATTSVVVRVTPQTAGIFTIPGITPKSQPVVLRVNPDSGTGNSSAPGNSGSPGAPPAVTGGSMAGGIRMAAEGAAFLRFIVPEREVYVGESVPVEIELGLRDGFARPVDVPVLTGDDFTFNNLSRKPEQIQKIIDGKTYTVLTWHSVLAAVKPGTFSLVVESPVTVRIRTQSPRESMLEDLLGDPFAQNIFGATVTKNIKVASPPSELKVLALPTEGRPPDFSGAVGTFKIESDISAATVAAGDPLTLKMRVTGSGNFDRVDSAMLEHLDQWKTYPPKSSFKPSDAIGYRGEKTFEQPLIASKPGVQTVPGLAFSYFDPTARRYDTARSSPLQVTVSPSLADSALTAPAVAAGAAAAPENQSHSGLRPDHLAAGAVADSLVPLYLRPSFLVISSALGLLFVGGWLAVRPREPNEESARRDRGTPKAAKRVLAQLEMAARSGDAALFFHAARAAVQQTLSARWRVPADEITTADVDTRLGGDAEDIRRLFALADEAKYSADKLNVTDFARWMQIVRRQLMGEQA